MLNHSQVHVVGGFRGLQHLLNRIFSVCPLPPSILHLLLSVTREHSNTCSSIAEVNHLHSVDCDHTNKLGDTIDGDAVCLETSNFFAFLSNNVVFFFF